MHLDSVSYVMQDNEKRTPLHAAAYLGDAEIIELLILSGKCKANFALLKGKRGTKNQERSFVWVYIFIFLFVLFY